MIVPTDINQKLNRLKTTAAELDTDIPEWTRVNIHNSDIHVWRCVDDNETYELSLMQGGDGTDIGLLRDDDIGPDSITIPCSDDGDALGTASVALTVPKMAYRLYLSTATKRLDVDINVDSIDVTESERIDTPDRFDTGIQRRDVERLICLSHALHEENSPDWESAITEPQNSWYHLCDHLCAIIVSDPNKPNGAVVTAKRGANGLTGLHATEYKSLGALIVEAVQNPIRALNRYEDVEEYDVIRLSSDELMDNSTGSGVA